MTRTFTKKVERFRYLALLLLSVCGIATSYAEVDITPATSDEINASIVTSTPVPLTWTNNADYPWAIVDTGEDGVCLQSFEVHPDKWTSTISVSFTTDKESIVSFKLQNDGQSGDDGISAIIDGAKYMDRHNSSQWKTVNVALAAGQHTIVFEAYDVYAWDGETYFSRIKDFSISDATWDVVTVNTPGEFVTTLVDVIGDRSVLEVEWLKVIGALNDKDWEGIKQLKGLYGLDLSNTTITVIPDEEFYGHSNLQSIILPETLISIGKRAFSSSSLPVITIPASVEYIGEYVWAESRLNKINFAENSKLKTIGSYAFYSSALAEIIMPNSVVSIGEAAFRDCYFLKNVKLSNSLTELPDHAFLDSKISNLEIPEGVLSIGREVFTYSSLESISLPESLKTINYRAFESTKLKSIVIPKNVSELGESAFRYCDNLKTVTLNSYTNNMNRTFVRSDSITTIIVPSVTPPSVVYDPFEYLDKNKVTVLVPEFALATYKVDSYWFQFKNLKSSAEISNEDFWAIHGHLKLNSSYTMSGTPSIDLESGGILDVAADTPLSMDAFTYNHQFDLPACLLNESNQVSANSLITKINIPRENTWYFFSPVTDVNMADVTYPATDSWVIRYYDGARRATENVAEGNWVTVPSNGTLKRGQGYIFQAATSGTLHLPTASSQLSSFFGIEVAPMTLDDNATENLEHAGWNLVGNPYPAYYDIYSMQLEAPITVYDGSTYRAYSLSDDDFVLSPMQPFFVQKSEADHTLGMPRSGRQGSNEIIRTAAPRANVVDANRQRLNLEIISGENDFADDYTRIVINESASLKYEGRTDASKFMSMNKDVAQIYSLGENSHPMAINERPYADGNAALGVYIPTAGSTYRIAASRADRKAWLYDAVAETEQDLTLGDYVFTADKAGNDVSRFSIRFAPQSTSVESVETTSVKVAGGKGLLTVNAPADAEIAVYAADGCVIVDTIAENGSLEMPVAAGVYVVKVNGQGYKTIVK